MTNNGIAHSSIHDQGANGAPEVRRPRAADPPRRARDRRTAPLDGVLWQLRSPRTDADRPVTVGLVGCEDSDGVTTLSTMLAVRACELGMGPVLVVECRDDRPRLRKAWGIAAGPGLSELLIGEADYSDCLARGPAGDLNAICASSSGGSDAAWDPGAVDAFLAEACGDHRLVLLDMPPASRLGQASLLAARLDHALLVVRAETTRSGDAERAADRLRQAGVPLKGVLLNRQRSYVPRWLQRWI